MLRRVRIGLVAALVPLALAGCGARNPVAGRVTYEGNPAQWGYVQFTPDLDKGSDGPTVTLKLSEDGRFSSAQEGKSVVPGEYKVAVTVVTAAGPQPPKVERQFQVTVPPGGLADLSFDITKKRPAKGKDEKGKDEDD